MKCVYKLEHKNCIEIDFETGEEICDTKMLGFFSSKEKCNESIKEYLLQPGFKDYPERFFIEKVYADIDDESDLTFAEMSVKNDFIDTIYKTHKEWLIGVGTSKQVIDGLIKESISEHIKFELI
jgi:hypothetical protein